MMRNGNGNTSGPTNTTTTIRPASQDHSGWVLLLGGGLIAVNFVFGGGTQVVSYLFSPVKASAPPNVDYSQIILMAIALLVLLGISKTGESGSNFAVIFLVAVWILWLLNSQGAVQKILGQSSAANTANSATTGNAPPTANTSTTNKKSTGQKPA